MSKSINEFKKEMIAAFGEFEVMATNLKSGQVLTSKGWIAQPTPRAEITASEYIALGDLQNKNNHLKPGTLKNLCNVIKLRRISEREFRN